MCAPTACVLWPDILTTGKTLPQCIVCSHSSHNVLHSPSIHVCVCACTQTVHACLCMYMFCSVCSRYFFVEEWYFSQSSRIQGTWGRWEEARSVQICKLSSRHSKHLWYHNASHVKHSDWLYTHMLLYDLLDKSNVDRKGVNFTIKILYGMCMCVYVHVCIVLCACVCYVHMLVTLSALAHLWLWRESTLQIVHSPLLWKQTCPCWHPPYGIEYAL